MDKFKSIFNSLVEKTSEYLLKNNLKAMVLGISGGIDSTVVSAICREVEDRTGIPFYGFSLPIKNKSDEFSTSELVGKAFCKEGRFKVINLKDNYEKVSEGFNKEKESLGIGKTLISEGNIQARLRMIYLYDIASNLGGIVFSTDNQTEYNLGFWTLHGDVGDINPMFGLWKTDVFDLARWLFEDYKNKDYTYLDRAEAIWESMQLIPTDGLGISNSDLEQLGTKSYEQADEILKKLLIWKEENKDVYTNKIDFIDNFIKSNPELEPEVTKKIVERHLNSEFKRKNLPVCLIPE